MSAVASAPHSPRPLYHFPFAFKMPHFPRLPSDGRERAGHARIIGSVVAARVMHSSEQTRKRAHLRTHARPSSSWHGSCVASPKEPLEMPINQAANSFPLSCLRRLFVCLFVSFCPCRACRFCLGWQIPAYAICTPHCEDC